MFRWKDFPYWIPILATLATAIKVQFWPVEALPLPGLIVTWAVACGFTFGYLWLVLRPRWKFFRGLAYTTKHGCHVVYDEGVSRFPKSVVEAEIDRVLLAWTAVNWKDVPGLAKELKGVLIRFKKDGFENPNRQGKATDKPKLFGGLAYPWYNLIYVGYRIPIKNTTLGHELGHFFEYRWTGDTNETTWQALAMQHQLPF